MHGINGSALCRDTREDGLQDVGGACAGTEFEKMHSKLADIQNKLVFGARAGHPREHAIYKCPVFPTSLCALSPPHTHLLKSQI